MAKQPFIHGAILKRQKNATTIQTGTRAGVEFADNREACLGALTDAYIGQGWSIESLIAQPMSPDMVARIANYYALAQAEATESGESGQC